jgi:uncharacterized membrane protein YkvA (DUF1232 family)
VAEATLGFVRTLITVLAIVVGAWVVLVVGLLLAGRGGAARQVAAFLPNLIALFRGLRKDPRVPRSSKLLLAFGLVWLASPIDLIPEFVPVIGPLDDAIVAALILRSVARRVGKPVLAEHWRGDPAALETFFRLARIRDGTS